MEWAQADGMTQLPEYLGRIPLAGRFIQEQFRTFVLAGSGYEGSIAEETIIRTVFLGKVIPVRAGLSII